jgi:hypothetical protein
MQPTPTKEKRVSNDAFNAITVVTSTEDAQVNELVHSEFKLLQNLQYEIW